MTSLADALAAVAESMAEREPTHQSRQCPQIKAVVLAQNEEEVAYATVGAGLTVGPYITPVADFATSWVSYEELAMRAEIERLRAENAALASQPASQPADMGAARRARKSPMAAAPLNSLARPAPGAPTYSTLEKWVMDGRAKTGCKKGCWTEPDGSCPCGKQSWLIQLGFI